MRLPLFIITTPLLDIDFFICGGVSRKSNGPTPTEMSGFYARFI